MCVLAGSLALAAVLSLAYIMYIYLSKNVLDVLTCVRKHTTIQAAGLPGVGLRVEIDCIAYIP